MDRRAFLAGAATAGAAGLAGCLGTAGEVLDGPGETAGEDTPVPFEEHPAANAATEQPYHGPEPGTAQGTIVAFEDPSCISCRRFHEQTVPDIMAELVEPGDATFVFRGYPVVYPWGKPAVHALEATFARDESAHWALVDHYFAEQDAFDEDNVLERTESFLAAETDLDAAAVVADAREKVFEDHVTTDYQDGKSAGARNTTPTVYMFRDGEFQTRARGSVGFDTVRSALGL